MTPITPNTHRPLTLDEVQRLLTASRGHPDEALLITALATGLRRGELLALQWQDGDLDQGTLAVRRTVRLLHSNEERDAEPKTGYRDIVLPEFLVGVLRKHRLRQDELKQAAGPAWQERDLVFPNPSGGSRRPDQLWRMMQQMARRAHLPQVGFHALRQTTLSLLLLELRVPLPVAWAMLGVRRGAAPFASLSPVSLAPYREAAAKLDALFRALLPSSAFEKADDVALAEEDAQRHTP